MTDTMTISKWLRAGSDIAKDEGRTLEAAFFSTAANTIETLAFTLNDIAEGNPNGYEGMRSTARAALDLAKSGLMAEDK